eukprot:7002938-Pyramimonas_sp.AAC.1
MPPIPPFEDSLWPPRMSSRASRTPQAARLRMQSTLKRVPRWHHSCPRANYYKGFAIVYWLLSPSSFPLACQV